MIVPVGASQFEHHCLVCPEQLVRPCEVRGGQVASGADQRDDGGVVTACVGQTACPRGVDFGNDIALPYARTDDFLYPVVDALDDAPGRAHVSEFLFGFYRALPVDEFERVLQPRVGQMRFKRLEAVGVEVVAIHFKADCRGAPATLDDDFREPVERMTLGRLDVIFLVVEDIFVGEVRGNTRPFSI